MRLIVRQVDSVKELYVRSTTPSCDEMSRASLFRCVYKANVSIAITLVKLYLEGKRGSIIQMLFYLATRLT
jgi:hypothetical protein